MKSTWLPGIVALMVVVLAACDDAEPNSSNPTDTQTADTQITDTSTPRDTQPIDTRGTDVTLPPVTRDGYPGIPYPTDALPAGIMPDLPTPGAQPGWPYDPITLETPQPSGGANEYVLSASGDDTTAGNGGMGTAEAPRRSFPDGPFPAGTRIFVLGSDTPYPEVDFDIDERSMTFNCTETEPCWIVGTNAPQITRRIDIENSTHLLIDGVHIVDKGDAGGRPWGQVRIVDASYITLRNLEIRGNGTVLRGGSVVSMSGSEFVMTYRAKIHTAGDWLCNTGDCRDVHGWRPLYRNRYLWLLESELYHLQGDGIQTGNSNNPNPQADTSHYIFIAGNTFYENFENALDNKNSYHVIFSSNDVHTHYAAPGAGGANSTSVILSNNSEGPWTDFHWAVNNRIWDTGIGIRDSGSEAGERNFMVGNVVWNCERSFIQANNAQDRESWLIHNTAFDVSTSHMETYQPGTNASLFVRGNVFVGAEVDAQSDIATELTHNILFGTTYNEARWDLIENNQDADPLLTSTEDPAPLPGSPAIDAITSEDPVYALFESLYGMSIRTDLYGTPRPTGGSWDQGAVERPDN